jgi:xanthine dehydrogenase accessory factor
MAVEGIRARHAESAGAAEAIMADGDIAVLADPEARCKEFLKPFAVVDAILAKRNTGTTIHDAQVVVALGPGFTAGVDCYAVVETMRGHDLGRVITIGSACPNTGIPGEIGGHTVERLLRAPADGLFQPLAAIGDVVKAGDTVAEVAGVPLRALISGVVRGLLREGTPVHKGMKSGDIDPRCEISHCFSVSDKARAIGGGVLEAVLMQGGILRG